MASQSIGGDNPLPIMPPQNVSSAIAPVMNDTNSQIAPPIAPIAPAAPISMAAAGAANNIAPPIMTAPISQVPIVQNAQNGYMPGPQQVQGDDNNPYNVHFGSVDYDPFANAVSGSQKTDAAWK